MIRLLIRAIAWFSNLLTTIMFIQAIMSWFVRDRRSQAYRIYELLSAITAPIVDPVRRFMSRFNTGPLDFSLVASMILVEVVARILIRLLLLLI